MMKKLLNKKMAGMSIVEMLVAIAIFSIGIGGISMLFLRTWRVNQYVLEMGRTSQAVSQGAKQIIGYIRGIRQGDDGSYPIKLASENDMIVFSDYNNDNITEKLHFYKDEGEIKMGITLPTGTMPKTYPSGDQSVITLAHYIVNDASTPVFYYYGNEYYGGASQTPLESPVSVSDVRMVKVYLQMNIDPDKTPDNIEIESLAEIRNLNDYDRYN